MRPRTTSSGLLSTAAALAVAAAAAAGLGTATPVHAALLASDSASNYTSWPGTANVGGTAALTTYSPIGNGTGFGTWSVSVQNNVNGPPYAGAFLSSSSGGYFGLYANQGSTGTVPVTTAIRQFSSSTGKAIGTLDVNQAFSVELQPGQGQFGIGTGPSAVASMSLDTISSTGTYTPVFTLAFTQDASNNYDLVTTITNSAGSKSYEATSNALTLQQLQSGVNAAFALGTAGAYTLTISPAAGNTSLTGDLTYKGSVSGAINGVAIINSDNASNYNFNNLAITAVTTPEPATLGLLGLGALGLVLLRRRTSA